MTKEQTGIPYSSMALAKEVAEVVWPWPYQYLRPIIMGMTFCGCVPHEHAQCEAYRISSCNFIADWTIFMGKVYLLLAWP